MLKLLKNNIKEIGYNIQDEAKLSTIFGIGNGYFGIRGSFEEFGDVFIQGCYIRGVFDQIIEIPATFADNTYMKRYYFDVQKVKTFEYQDSCINVFDPTTIKIFVNGKMFLPWEGKVVKWERYIDFSNGGLFRNVIWDDGLGNLTEFKFQRYCSFANNHLFFQKVQIKKINHNLDVMVKMGVDTLVKTNGQHKSKVTFIENKENELSLISHLGQKYNMSVALNAHNEVSGCHFVGNDDSDQVYSSMYLLDGQEASLTKVVGVYASVDGVDDILNAAKTCSTCNYDGCLKEHINVYKTAFNQVDIKIKGHDKINVLLRYANYQTLIGFDRFDSVHSLSAKNLTAEKYNQFVWWDAEIFQLPFLIYNFPKAAKACLEYRYRCLNKAKENALKNGYKGAQFAFCSSVDGEEKVWEYARHPFLQIHISSDIAYGIYNYYKASNDIDFMLNHGLEMMVEVLKFFHSRTTLKDGKLHILGVTGTDEHHPYVDDNAYTNYEVQFVAQKTLEIASKLGYLIPNETKKEICELKDLLYLPTPNERGIIPQFEGYLNLKPYLPITGNGSGKNFQMKASGLYHESQIIKQPDVMNIFTYVDVGLDEKYFKQNWKYYEKMCEASSSLTFPVHTICAIKNNEYKKFEQLLIDTLTIDINDIHNCAYQGVHAACLAGGWYAIFSGLFGINIKEDAIYINPSKCNIFDSVSMNFVYHNSTINIKLCNKKLILSSKDDCVINLCYKGHKMLHHKVSILDI